VSDPVDNLEALLQAELERAGALGVLPVIYSCIDIWRRGNGGDRIYLAKKSTVRRNEKITALVRSGLSVTEVAAAVGLSLSQTRRVARSKKSTHIL
jgi:hypothetical protein